jgi:hypothetical protein
MQRPEKNPLCNKSNAVASSPYSLTAIRVLMLPGHPSVIHSHPMPSTNMTPISMQFAQFAPFWRGAIVLGLGPPETPQNIKRYHRSLHEQNIETRGMFADRKTPVSPQI